MFSLIKKEDSIFIFSFCYEYLSSKSADGELKRNKTKEKEMKRARNDEGIWKTRRENCRYKKRKTVLWLLLLSLFCGLYCEYFPLQSKVRECERWMKNKELEIQWDWIY